MKHKLEGIGGASASMVMAFLKSNPNTAFISAGILGRIVFFLMKLFFMYLANVGLIVLNVGAAKIETIVSQNDFDGSWESAEKMIKSIRETGRELTDEEIQAIDQPVIDAFNKFAKFGRVRERQTRHKTPATFG